MTVSMSSGEGLQCSRVANVCAYLGEAAVIPGADEIRFLYTWVIEVVEQIDTANLSSPIEEPLGKL